ncbi:hypothetical protein C4564_03840 [Candidatus Microgenomates bacterium]|nr:MAG: hypothetical protein C4564_03840 [Candidatus Microgenomates bacterium]
MYKYNQKTIVPTTSEKFFSQDEVDILIAKNTGDRTLASLLQKSNKLLFTMTSVFPLDIFPNTINIEEGRITIITRHLFSSEEHSIDIKNISNVFIYTSIFFSQLVVISKTFEENEIKLRNLIPSQAVYARRIIEGLRVIDHAEIDTSGFSKRELIEMLEKLSSRSSGA